MVLCGGDDLKLGDFKGWNRDINREFMAEYSP